MIGLSTVESAISVQTADGKNVQVMAVLEMNLKVLTCEEN